MALVIAGNRALQLPGYSCYELPLDTPSTVRDISIYSQRAAAAHIDISLGPEKRQRMALGIDAQLLIYKLKPNHLKRPMTL